jgi:2-polyprenyl-3-methyl-5-hydroxy-6-metoxy-1,4-benzoquinol methylase
MPSSQQLQEAYSAAYCPIAAQGDQTGFESNKQMLLGLAGFLLNHRVQRGARVLELGAGTGRFASILSARGINVDGVELGDNARHEAKKRYGFDFKSDLSEITSDSYDWAIAVEVLEHLSDPFSTLNTLRTKLKPNGMLFLTTPNAKGLAARLYGSDWREAKNPLHLVLFTPCSLRQLLPRSGYKGIEILRFSPLGDLSAGRRLLHRGLQTLDLYGGLRVIARRAS